MKRCLLFLLVALACIANAMAGSADEAWQPIDVTVSLLRTDSTSAVTPPMVGELTMRSDLTDWVMHAGLQLKKSASVHVTGTAPREWRLADLRTVEAAPECPQEALESGATVSGSAARAGDKVTVSVSARIRTVSKVKPVSTINCPSFKLNEHRGDNIELGRGDAAHLVMRAENGGWMVLRVKASE